MRVAWVTPSAPDHDGGGGQIRQAHLLLSLTRTFEVVLLTSGVVTDPAVRRAATRIVELPGSVAPEVPRWRRRLDDVGGAIGSQSREVRALTRVRAGLDTLLDGVEADVVMIEYAGLAPLRTGAGAHPGLRGAGWILTLHNLPSRMADHQATILPRRRQRWLFQRDATRARRLERAAVSDYDRVIVVSAADADAIGGGPDVAVVANGVDVDRFVPTPVPSAPRILFSGALYTAPNTDAAVWFCTVVLPLIRVRRPDVTVDVVGARPPAEVGALADLAGVRVHADVDTVVPYLVAARVAVVPIRIGSGTRLKAMEAWAAGRPVVGTTVGLEGLAAEPGRHALLADDAPGLAAAVVEVLGDDRLARRLATAGRALVEAHYGWDTQGDRLVGIVAAVAAARP